MMTIKPLPNGRRSIEIGCPYLDLVAELGPHTGPLYDRDGNEVGVVHTCSVLDPREPPAPPAPSPPGVGGRLHRLLVARYNLSPCAKCTAAMAEMDALGPAGCERERERLVADMWERRSTLQGWKGALVKLPGVEALAKRELNNLLTEAIEASK